MAEATWSPVNLRPVQEVARDVAKYVLRQESDECLDLAVSGIKRGIDRLNLETWRWGLSFDDQPTVAGDTEVSLQPDFSEPRRLMAQDPNGKEIYRIKYLGWAEFMREFPNASVDGTPVCYSIPNSQGIGSLSFNCPMSDGFVTQYPSVRLWYYRRLVYPSDSPEAPLDCWPEAVDFLEWHAKTHVAATYAPLKVAFAKNQADEILRSLIAKNLSQTDWE